MAYILGSNFFARDISHTFCRSATKFGRIMDLANRNLFPELRQLSSRSTVIPCGDMHQSFSNSLVKWFFDNFPMFADRFRLVSIHCVVRGLDANFLYMYPESRGSSLRQHVSRSLYAIARPSVCRLSVVYLSTVCLSVMFVRATQAVQIFGNISTAFGTLATL